jgi:hypothetical protein
LQAAEQRALGINFDPNAPRKYIRMHLPGYEGSSVFGARQVGQKVNFFTSENLYLQPADWQGQAVFPVVFEPFAGEPFITAVNLLTPQSTLGLADAPVALEVVLKSGRHDIVYVAANGKATTIPDVGAFSGEFAYLSREGANVRQASLVGGTRLQADGVLLTAEREAFEGEVQAVDYLAKTATMKGPLPTNAVGAVLEIGPPTRRTSYTISGVNGTQVTFRKGMDLAGSRIQSFTATGNLQTVTAIAESGVTVTSDDQESFWRLGAESKGNTLQLTGGADAKAALKVGDMVRIWEFGPGDRYRLPAWTSVTRDAQGKVARGGNVSGKVQLEK